MARPEECFDTIYRFDAKRCSTAIASPASRANEALSTEIFSGAQPIARPRHIQAKCRDLKIALGAASIGRSDLAIESLKSNAHLIRDARKRKNLTHLQSILLFKDSRRPCFSRILF